MPSIMWESGGDDRRLPVPIHTPKYLSYCKLIGPLEACLIHWRPGRSAEETGKSSPCTGDHCVDCNRGYPNQRNVYAASLLWNEGIRNWNSVILSLNNSFDRELQKIPEYQSKVLIFKVEKLVGKPTRYSVGFTEKIIVPFPAVEAFDVRNAMERFWGLRRTPKPELAATPPTIPFQQRSA